MAEGVASSEVKDRKRSSTARSRKGWKRYKTVE